MARTSTRTPEMSMLDELWGAEGDSLDLDQKLNLIQRIREQHPELGPHVDRNLVIRLQQQFVELRKAAGYLKELKDLIEKFRSTPWVPATFLRPVVTHHGNRAMVMIGPNMRRVVELDDEITVDSLASGEEVFLGRDLNLVMGKSPSGLPPYGETGLFERQTADGRIVLRCREEEVVVEVAAQLKHCRLERGDQIRWDRTVWMAFEKIDRQEGHQFLLDDVPDVSTDCVGGQDAALKKLLDALTAGLIRPDKAAQYGVGHQRSILMVGPPGTGKTLMARTAASEVQKRSGRRCRFGVVKPAEWESPWVGETQHNIRSCFAALRKAARDGTAILFLDEIEAIGRIRGNGIDHHGDKFLAALLAELDGFAQDHSVAVIAATNRTDLVDPALLERLSDVEIQVGRPTRDAARTIFGIHLPASLPMSPNGHSAEMTHRDLIETAISRLYSPNGGNELCTLHFRDGKTRTILARDLVSGRLIHQICKATKQRALLRDVREGTPGLQVEDMEDAVADALNRLASTLTRYNARAHLMDLPQDVDIVNVEPVAHRIKRPHRYVRQAPFPSQARPET